MPSTDGPRCDNCGKPTTADSVAASAGLPAWVGGPFCPDCLPAALSLTSEHPRGDEFFGDT